MASLLMASFKPILLIHFLILYSLLSTTAALNSLASSRTKTSKTKIETNSTTQLHVVRSVCESTPYPDACLDSLKLSISININPGSILTFLLQSLQSALSEAGKLSTLLLSTNNNQQPHIVEKQKGTLQDCKDLHEITVSSLKRSLSRINAVAAGAATDSASSSSSKRKSLADVNAFLSAALSNKNTCLEGLDSASGPLKPILVNSIMNTYKHVSNSLSMVSKSEHAGASSKNDVNGDRHGQHHRRRLLMDHDQYPSWLSRKARKILQDDDDSGGDDNDDDEYEPGNVLTVAADGSGNFTTITEAINFAPNSSADRIMIYIREGVYDENVEIPIYKPNIVLLGDGADVTTITGDRSVDSGWTTFRSATVAVSGEGFLARDITFENRAGAENHQAVALRINADLAAVYRCTITGYQDTLYVHSFRQFYRECDIYGTVDYIFGNAAAVFQGCSIVSRLPMPGQFTVITAQSRDSPDEDTGMSMQNCSILATEDLFSSAPRVKSYLGRPWRVYSRTVFLESYIDVFINARGWTEWPGGQGLDTLYYGEYENYGPGSDTGSRVAWPGYHVMDYDDASNFTVSELITGQEWLDSTSFPYDDGV